MNTPDLTFYYLIHRRMRESSVQLAAAASSLEERDRASRGRQLVRWYAGFEGELHEHHTVEDNVFFPALFELVPSLRGYLRRIDDEHEHLTQLISRTRESLAAVANTTVPFAEAARGAATASSDLASLLEGHLDFEDAEVLPLFTRHMDGDEYRRLEDTAMGNPQLGLLKWTVPWVMAGASVEEQAHLLEGAPFMMKLVWMATRRGYGRLEQAALRAPATAVAS